MGEVSAAAGRAAYDTIVRAVDAASSGDVDAIATAPVNKLAFAQAGLPWKGHTDLLAHLCGTSRVAMMFHAPELKVVLITVHVPLSDVPVADHAGPGRSDDRSHPRGAAAVRRRPAAPGARRAQSARRRRRRARRRRRSRARAGGGARARARHRRRAARFPPTPCSCARRSGEFDCVVACYHDQGLIPVKLLAFGHAVNVTIGLPIIRTSVDHGTAFDIAGKGVADPGSMIEAVKLAARHGGRSARRRHRSDAG